MVSKIATWNLCLGLLNKRDIVLNELNNKKIDVCCLQEIELDTNVPYEILGNNLYRFEPERNTCKKRVGIFINKNVKYKRRDDLEPVNRHLIIIDLMLNTPLRIITIYWSFRPPDGRSPTDFFKDQLTVMYQNCTRNTIILGDFNLDAKMQFMLDYPHKQIYSHLNEFTSEFNFEQIVDFPTWSRSINNTRKESTLDHIYSNNIHIVSKCFFEAPLFGDHVIVIIELLNNKFPPPPLSVEIGVIMTQPS